MVHQRVSPMSPSSNEQNDDQQTSADSTITISNGSKLSKKVKRSRSVQTTMDQETSFYKKTLSKLRGLEYFTRYIGLAISADLQQSSRSSRWCVYLIRTCVLLFMLCSVARICLSLHFTKLDKFERVYFFGDFSGVLAHNNTNHARQIAFITLGYFSFSTLTILVYITSHPFIPNFEKLWTKGSIFVKKLPTQNTTAYIKWFRIEEIALYSLVVLCTLLNLGATLVILFEPLVRLWADMNFIAYVLWSMLFIATMAISTLINFVSLAQFVVTSRLIRFNFIIVHKTIKSFVADEDLANIVDSSDDDDESAIDEKSNDPNMGRQLPALKLQMNHIVTTNNMEIGANNETSATKHRSHLLSKLRTAIQFHFLSMTLLAVSNRFWKKYICLFYLTLTPTLTFCIYQAINGELNLIFGFVLIAWTIVIAFQMSLVSLVSVQLSSEAHRPYDLLYQVTLQETDSEIREEANQLMSRLTGISIGFYFWDIFPITGNIVISIVSAIITYFFVINEYWN